MPKKSFVLCILDGWGEIPDTSFNAIRQAQTPVWHSLVATYPHTQLQASGLAVGLPEGQMGNSEVGHMTLGAGRVIYQDLPRIQKAMTDNAIGSMPAFQDFVSKILQGPTKTCHLMGLLSPGGVHSHQDQLIYMAQQLAAAGLSVCVHAFLDGRDTPPKSAIEALAHFRKKTASLPSVRLASVSGRYYSMDRDNRWDRVEKAYETLVLAEGPVFDDAEAYVQSQYHQETTDEFVMPARHQDFQGIQDGDGLFMANFRADRVRQLLQSLTDVAFTFFIRMKIPRFSAVMGMAHYGDQFNDDVTTLFPPADIQNCLGQVISEAGLTQMRIAETEKYAHVTFFFNGGREEPFKYEDRLLIPSPKVATYDLQPQMSALQVAEKVCEAIQGRLHDLIVVNFANTDMVGHTGDLEAAIKSVECVDMCLGKIHAAVLEAEGTLLITADHGNAEVMYDPGTKMPHTAHTTNPVPFLVCRQDLQNQLAVTLTEGGLSDVAPTLLKLMGLSIPQEMTGRCLLKSDEWQTVCTDHRHCEAFPTKQSS